MQHLLNQRPTLIPPPESHFLILALKTNLFSRVLHLLPIWVTVAMAKELITLQAWNRRNYLTWMPDPVLLEEMSLPLLILKQKAPYTGLFFCLLQKNQLAKTKCECGRVCSIEQYCRITSQNDRNQKHIVQISVDFRKRFSKSSSFTKKIAEYNLELYNRKKNSVLKSGNIAVF